MSNPLAYFRTNGKVLITVFAALLMVAFLVENVVTSRSGGKGGGSPNAVVSVGGTEIGEAEMSSLHRADLAANALLELVTQAARDKKRNPRPFPQPNYSNDEAALVNKLLHAKKAHHFGATLSDADVDELIKDMADGAVTESDLSKLRDRALNFVNNSVTTKQLYAQLRVNILAQQFSMMLAGTGMDMNISPIQAWDFYRRANRRVKLELLPIKVEGFVSEVKATPTDAQLKELFEKYKEFSPNPNSSAPGFATPHKITFSYVKLDFQKFQDAAKAAITEDQLKAEYAKRIDQGEFVVKELPEEKKEDAPKTETPANKEEADEKATDKPVEKTPAEKSETPATTEPQPTNDAPKPEEKTPVESKPETKSAEPAPAESKSFDVEDDLKKTTETAATAVDKAAPSETKAAVPATETKPAGDAKPATDSTTEAKPAAENTEPVAKPVEKTRVKTFDEVREDLLNQLSQKPAEEAVQAARKDIDEALKALAEEYRVWEQENKGKPEKEQAEKPSAAKHVREPLKKHTLEMKTLPMLDQYEITEEELGQSFYFIQNRQFPFTDVQYRFTGALYQPSQSRAYLQGIDFIFWKEAEEAPKVMELKEVRDDVILAWKRQQAFDVAKKEAKAIAAKVKDKSLRESFPEGVPNAEAIVETDSFSWLTNGVLPQNMMQFEMSTIKQVKSPSLEFMETMHRLKPNEVDIAADEPHKLVYIMRLMEESPSEPELRDRFLAQGIMFNPAIFSQYNNNRNAYLQSIMADLERDFKITWYRRASGFNN
jgi:SurA N-terminal domain